MLIINKYVAEISGASHRNLRPFLKRSPSPNVTLDSYLVVTSEL